MQMRVPGAAGMQEALVTKLGLAESPPSPHILEKLSELGLAQQLMPTDPHFCQPHHESNCLHDSHVAACALLLLLNI